MENKDYIIIALVAIIIVVLAGAAYAVITSNSNGNSVINNINNASNNTTNNTTLNGTATSSSSSSGSSSGSVSHSSSSDSDNSGLSSDVTDGEWHYNGQADDGSYYRWVHGSDGYDRQYDDSGNLIGGGNAKDQQYLQNKYGEC